MAIERSSQTYSCKVVGLGYGERAEYVRQRVKSGDALTLEPDAANHNATAVYHYNRKIGYITDKWIRNVLKPGCEYEAWAGYVEHDDADLPVALNIEVTIFGKRGGSAVYEPKPMRNSITRTTSTMGTGESHGPIPPYRSSPVMFRAHPIGFAISLLLAPVVIGAIILLVWVIKARTTHLEIDDDTVRYETGVFYKDRRALSRRSIRTVRVTQTLLNRMLNVGAIEIFTAGDVPEIRAASMFEPNEIRELLGK